MHRGLALLAYWWSKRIGWEGKGWVSQRCLQMKWDLMRAARVNPSFHTALVEVIKSKQEKATSQELVL